MNRLQVHGQYMIGLQLLAGRHFQSLNVIEIRLDCGRVQRYAEISLLFSAGQ